MDAESVGDKGSKNCNVSCEEELENYKSRCSELEERSRKSDERRVVLELEVEKKKSELQLLEVKFKALEAEKLAIGEQIGILKRRSNELEVQISRTKGNEVGEENRQRVGVVDFSEESDKEEKIVQMMVDNKVLECEKKLAEGTAEAWKKKSRDLEERVSLLEKKLLRSRAVECPSTGNVEVDIRHKNSSKTITKLCGPKDGLDGIDHVQYDEIMRDFVQTVHESSSIGTGACSWGHGIEVLQMTGTPSTNTPELHFASLNGERRGIQLQTHMESGKRVRKQLFSGEDGVPSKKMAPSTPAGARSASIITIDISDNDDEPDNILPVQKHIHDICGSKERWQKIFSENSLKSSYLGHNDEEETSGCNENDLFISTTRRRQVSNVVISDGDSDNDSDSDDSLPICALGRKSIGGKSLDATGSHSNSCSITASVSGLADVMDSVTPLRRRRLVTMRHCEEKDGPARNSLSNLQSIETKESVGNEGMKETGSESEGESLGGFIVESSDGDDHSGSDCTEDVSDGNFDFDEIITTIGRNRCHKSRWEFEAEMLAAFGKDPELCMKAVCALYRQQTSEEKCSKETLYLNQRGFSKFDAHRGTALAELLTDGDPEGNVHKSVEELLEDDPEALELCKTLATHYSKQLFEIYKKNEDPFFHPL